MNLFVQVDKDWAKLMQKATDTGLVTEACANELLRSSLPVMYSELEKCQKSLEGYLEQKRSKFPRFYFVSNPGLLVILSQGESRRLNQQHSYGYSARHAAERRCVPSGKQL